MNEIKWKISPAPVGKWKGFHKRQWPTAYYIETDNPAIMISCPDSYNPAQIKAGHPHAPLSVYIAQWHHDEKIRREKGAFTWRKLKSEFTTLDEARKAGERALAQHPEFAPANAL
jgi:hypothetical protein